MKREVAFIIDGHFMRKRIARLKAFFFNGPEIRRYCLKHLKKNDCLYRIFYYDSPPLDATGHHPITGKQIKFGSTAVARRQHDLIASIKNTPNFALRLGRPAWSRDWQINPKVQRELLKGKIGVEDIDPNAVMPNVRQKLVDMKIGLDIASISLKRVANHLIVISGDSDLVPALKLARTEGMQVCLDPLWSNISEDMKEHVDYITTRIPKPN